MAGYEGEFETGSDRSTGELCADRLHTADDRGAGTVQERWIRDDNGICQSGIWTERFDNFQIHKHQPEIQRGRLFGPLRPEFAQIGSSKLSEMLSMPDSDLEMVRPELPKEDIRELKRFNKAEPEPEKADSLEKLVLKFLETNREIAKELEESEAYAAGEVEKMAEIVNPSGTKTFRMGLFFMAMYENDIQIKQFGQTPRKMSWAEFFQIARKILESQEWQAEEVEGTEEREEAQKSRESVEQERKQEKSI